MHGKYLHQGVCEDSKASAQSNWVVSFLEHCALRNLCKLNMYLKTLVS